MHKIHFTTANVRDIIYWYCISIIGFGGYRLAKKCT